MLCEKASTTNRKEWLFWPNMMLVTASNPSAENIKLVRPRFTNGKKHIAVEQDEDKRRLKQLEEENARLKKMYAELSLDHSILQQGYEMIKKYQAQDAKKK